MFPMPPEKRTARNTVGFIMVDVSLAKRERMITIYRGGERERERGMEGGREGESSEMV